MTKVYYDEQRDCLFVEGSKDAFPSRSLGYSVSGSKITIWVGEFENSLATKEWDSFTDRNGNSFATLGLTTTYLGVEFSRAYEPLKFGGELIDDESPSLNKVYSSQKVENKVGDESKNFVQIYETALN